MPKSLQLIDLPYIKAVVLQNEPFPYAIISHSLVQNHIAEIQQDYPKIEDAGSFPLSAVSYGPQFAQLIAELKSDAFRQVMAEKFAMDLGDKPVMITVRGRADATDGRIHKDSKSKLITVLLYMNEDWDTDEGRLRLLNDSQNLDNYFAEVSPRAGTMLIFKVTDNGWHGHKTFVGTRKVIQLNYVTHEAALNKHATRHKISAFFKNVRRKLLGKNKAHECVDC